MADKTDPSPAGIKFEDQHEAPLALHKDSEQMREVKLVEYQAAQEMLRHYDTLNWQIGAILIAATMVLTGLVIQKDSALLLKGASGLAIVVGLPIISAFVLGIWFFWFKRHRHLYNYRNETLHRLEIQLGMYHFLRVLEGEKRSNKLGEELHAAVGNLALQELMKARKMAGYCDSGFSPLIEIGALPKPSGFFLVKVLAAGIPILQLAMLLAIRILVGQS